MSDEISDFLYGVYTIAKWIFFLLMLGTGADVAWGKADISAFPDWAIEPVRFVVGIGIIFFVYLVGLVERPKYD